MKTDTLKSYVAKFSTDYDLNFGGSVLIIAKDKDEAILKAKDFCHNRLLEQIGNSVEKFSVDIKITRFNNRRDGSISTYEVFV
jgi:hypothetical protein